MPTRSAQQQLAVGARTAWVGGWTMVGEGSDAETLQVMPC